MDQVQVLSAVCKKLNNDVESLVTQSSIRESAVSQLDITQQKQDEQLRQFSMDLQMKLSKTDTIVQKIQIDVEQLSHGLRDAINGQQELNRSNAQRHQELKSEVNFYFILIKKAAVSNGVNMRMRERFLRKILFVIRVWFYKQHDIVFCIRVSKKQTFGRKWMLREMKKCPFRKFLFQKIEFTVLRMSSKPLLFVYARLPLL